MGMTVSGESKAMAIKFFDDSQENDSTTPASALFQLSTVEGVGMLVEVLASAQIEAQEAIAKYTAEQQLYLRKVELGRHMLHTIAGCVDGTDWTDNGPEYQEHWNHIKIKAVSVKLMATKEIILQHYLIAMQDVLAGLKSLEKIARKLLATQEEQGEEYFKDSLCQTIHAVTLKVIDDCWNTLQTGRLTAKQKLTDYASLGDVPFEVVVGTVTGPDGQVWRAKVDLHDASFWQNRVAGGQVAAADERSSQDHV